MNDKKSEQTKHAKQEKLFIDELWIAHAAFPDKKNDLSFKKPGITTFINNSGKLKECK